MLFNWGEPFLHPKLPDILKVLNNLNLNWGISTNASKRIEFMGEDTFKRCQYFCFSMSGFSQDSYDKIHGFNFENITENIVSITNNIRLCGITSTPIIAFHIYQFNIEELRPAIMFAAKHELGILPSYAAINDFERMIKYLSGKLEYEDVLRAGKELLLHPMDNINFIHRPAFTTCSQFSFLSLDSDCNLITCCGDSTVIGKVYDTDLTKLNSIRKSSPACKRCIKAGLYVFSHNSSCPSTIINGAMKGLPQFLIGQKGAIGFTPKFT